MATVLTENRHCAGFLVAEEDNFYSRAKVVVTGSATTAGMVVGRLLASATTVAAGAGNTGNGAFGAVTLAAGVQEGVYRVTFIEPGTNVGTFTVEGPDGKLVGTGVVAVAFSGGGLSFTIADGATDFVSGDQFLVYVRAGTIAAGSNTGNGVATLFQTSEGAQVGAYALVCTAAATNAGTFSVTAPDGTVLAPLTVGTRYTKAGLDLTIADGSSDFIVGDSFTFTVTRGKVKAWDPANTDGSDVAYGVLWDAYDASSADVKGNAIVRQAVVNGLELTWKAGLDASQQATGRAQLAARGILSR
jgi:hypothetical protein